MIRSCRFLAAAASLTILLVGCSSDEGPTLYEVTGRATRNGQPVNDLRVHFAPESGRESSAMLDADGRFRLQFGWERNGALPGMHRVWCERPPTTPQEELDMQNGTFVMHPDALAILDKYGSVENTPLTISVDTDGQQVSLELD
ncbi:MAG: hypothetical protein O3B13_04180 [Planctomycetota bacterium]|nr:hypothetical protein [Planctomycetota bacterium]